MKNINKKIEELSKPSRNSLNFLTHVWLSCQKSLIETPA